MSLLDTTECCFFYREGGSAQAGGCTKACLDAAGGDLSTVMGPNGEPLLDGPRTFVNFIEGGAKKCKLYGDDYILQSLPAGLVIRFENDFYEFAGLSPAGELVIDTWAQPISYQYSSSVSGTTTTLNVYGDVSIFSAGQNLLVDNNSEPGVYTIASVDPAGSQVTVYDPTGRLPYTSGQIAPETAGNVGIVIGGAWGSLQNLLDNIEVRYRSQWVFVGSDLTGECNYINSSYGGVEENCTFLSIVGYVDNAYDCLPAGWGYYPEDAPHGGEYYQKPIQWAVLNDLDQGATCQLRKANGLNAVSSKGYGDALFILDTYYRNSVRVMGFNYQNPKNTAGREVSLVYTGYSDGKSDFEFASIRHCVKFENPAETMGGTLMMLGEGTVAEVLDSFGAATLEQDGMTPLLSNYTYANDDFNGFCEVAGCVFKGVRGITSRYNTVVIHDCILKGNIYGSLLVTDGAILRFNNIWYGCNRAFHLNGQTGRAVSFNEIIVVDTSDANWEALVYAWTGGQLQINYNCYYNLSTGQPIEPIAILNNLNWKGPQTMDEMGPGSLVADPMFVNPDNWDFRLRAGSPCIEAGRPDALGNRTHIGLHVEKLPTGIYGKKRSIYGV